MKQYLLAEWLMHETEALVIRRATRQRLKFEARTWQRTYAKINSQIDKCLADVGELGTAIDGWIADSTAGRLTDNAQTTIKTTCKDEFPNTLKSHNCLIPPPSPGDFHSFPDFWRIENSHLSTSTTRAMI